MRVFMRAVCQTINFNERQLNLCVNIIGGL